MSVYPEVNCSKHRMLICCDYRRVNLRRVYFSCVAFLVLKIVLGNNLLKNKTIILLNLAEYPGPDLPNQLLQLSVNLDTPRDFAG